jgi:predicted aspartyl protease
MSNIGGMEGRRMNRIILAILPVMSAALSMPAHAEERPDRPADCKQVALAELPMTLKSGHVTIPALLDGKDVTLGIDTGGPFSSLALAAAHRLGNVGHRDDLRIGDHELNRVYMAWMESFPGVDGLIAPDVLSRYDVEFDFGGGIFRLFKPKSCANRAATWTGSPTVIPFTLTDDGHVRVTVTLDGQSAYAILDTGAPISILSMQDAERMFGLDPDSTNLKVAKTMVSGLWSNLHLAPYTSGVWNAPSRAVSAYSYPFKTIIMGELSVTDPPIALIQGRNFLGPDSASLLLGNDVLSHFHLVIAYHE